MSKRRQEKVSVSFHYMVRRNTEEEDGDNLPLDQNEFEELLEKIESQPLIDVSDEETKRLVRMGKIVPFSKFKRENSQLAFAKFEAAYSGHSFKNSDFGKIERDSVNQREFNCLLYLTKTGRLVVGAQYLGNFGSYYDLRNGITRFLRKGSQVIDHSFRDDSLSVDDAKPKEIQIEVTKPATSLHADNVLANRRAIVLKRSRKGDDWEEAAKSKIWPIFQSKHENRAEKLAKTLNEIGLWSVENDELVNGKIVLDVGKGQKTVYLFEPFNFATRFPLDVPLNKDGHPKTKPVREAMAHVLKENVIKKLGQ